MKFVYLIKSESLLGDLNYKIGISKTPEKRLKSLQTGNPNKLEIIFLFQTKWNTLLETTLHRTFNIERETGEWFSLTSEQVDNFLLTCDKIENNLNFLKNDDNKYLNL